MSLVALGYMKKIATWLSWTWIYAIDCGRNERVKTPKLVKRTLILVSTYVQSHVELHLACTETKM